MIAYIVKSVLRQRSLWLLVLLSSLLASAFVARRVKIGFQYRDFYAYPGNPELTVFDRYSDYFGDPGGYVAVLIQAPSIFQPAVLGYVADISRALEASSAFSHVMSLSTVRLLRAQGDDVASGPVMEQVPQTPEQLAALRQLLTASGLTRRRLVSTDGTTTAVLADMRQIATTATIPEQRAAIAAVRAVLEAHPAPAGVSTRLTGPPVVEVETTDTLLHDLVVLTPLTLLALTIALWVMFRTLQAVFIVLTTVSVSVCWTVGVFALIGRPVDIIGSVIPTVLLVYGAVDPIFVFTRYRSKVAEGATREEAILKTMSELAQPCLLTSVTTALGFAAFVTGTLPTVRYFGLVLAIGVMLAFLTTITVLPLLVSLCPAPKPSCASGNLSSMLDRRLVGAWRVVNGHRRAVLLGAVLAIGLGALAGRRLIVNNEYVGSLPRGEALDATRTLERQLSGVVRMVAFFEGPVGSMKRPEVLRAMQAVGVAARRQALTGSSVSLADLIAEANQAFMGGAPAERRIPTSPALIAQYLSLLDPSDRADFVSDDYARAHALTLVTDLGCAPMASVRRTLQLATSEQHLERLGIHTSLTGNGVMGCDALDGMVREVLWGFVVAFGIVLALEAFVFRSLRIALLSIVPNLIPVAACFLVMFVLRIDFRIDNALFVCVSIGGLFNTTIHIVARILQQRRVGVTDPDRLVEEALRTVGPPSFYTAMVLSLGFAVLLVSRFSGLRELGFLSMITLVVAFCSDALVTSVLMRSFFDWRSAPLANSSAGHGGKS